MGATKKKQVKKNKKSKSKNKITKKIVNVPLSNVVSLGPDASEGSIFYCYISFNNILSFFRKEIKNKKIENNICLEMIPILRYNLINHKIEAYKGGWSKKNRYNMKKYISDLNKCMKYRYIILNLAITAEKKFNFYDIDIYENHANIILIDTLQKTVELFEPHGNRGDGSELYSAVGAYKNVSTNMSTFFKKLLPNYKYIPPKTYEIKHGLQMNVDAFEGLCITWLHYIYIIEY